MTLVEVQEMIAKKTPAKVAAKKKKKAVAKKAGIKPAAKKPAVKRNKMEFDFEPITETLELITG
jgi:hypothetical protein